MQRSAMKREASPVTLRTALRAWSQEHWPSVCLGFNSVTICRDMRKTEPSNLVLRARALEIAAQAVGALAAGAIAIGALAVGAVAIGRLAIGRAKIKRLEIDELNVRNLRVTGSLETPGKGQIR